MAEPYGTPRRLVVIGGGVAGLGVALRALDAVRGRDLDLAVTVLEAGSGFGGNLRTQRDDGWQLEWGPNGFLDNEPATLRLVTRLGLDGALQRSTDAARRRFLVVGGRLREIPTSPAAFLTTDLFRPRAKLRVLGELFVPGRKDLGRADEDPGDRRDGLRVRTPPPRPRLRRDRCSTRWSRASSGATRAS